jgi:hypothetical protein
VKLPHFVAKIEYSLKQNTTQEETYCHKKKPPNEKASFHNNKPPITGRNFLSHEEAVKD